MDKIMNEIKTNWVKYAIGLGVGAASTFAVLKVTKKIK